MKSIEEPLEVPTASDEQHGHHIHAWLFNSCCDGQRNVP